jgi:hypothetical protein
MKYYFLIYIVIAGTISCQTQKMMNTESYSASNSKTELTCKMLPEELKIRKETVLQSLKSKILERKELKTGYAFKFPGNDQVVDEIVEFIKTERECCDFFVFNLSVSGDKSEAWLTMTGVEGAKDFITEELGL